MIIIDVLQYDRPIGVLTVSVSEWRDMHTVDHITVDGQFRVLPEFNIHGLCAVSKMQSAVNALIGIQNLKSNNEVKA